MGRPAPRNPGEQRIEKPSVIVGLPRTGSSLLPILLDLDTLARAPLHWESADLVPPASLAIAASHPRSAENQRETDRLLALNPAFASMHPTGATLAQESVACFMYDVRTLGVETQAFVPSYGQLALNLRDTRLRAASPRPAGTPGRTAHRALDPQDSEPPLVPSNTSRAIPRRTHHLDPPLPWAGHHLTRESREYAAAHVHASDRPAPAAEEWKGKVLRALETGMRFDASAQAGWCDHVQYDNLIADPAGCVSRIHAHFGADLSRLYERRMQAWMGERQESAMGRHAYGPADFGWSYPALAEEFSHYTERYDVSVG